MNSTRRPQRQVCTSWMAGSVLHPRFGLASDVPIRVAGKKAADPTRFFRFTERLSASAGIRTEKQACNLLTKTP